MMFERSLCVLAHFHYYLRIIKLLHSQKNLSYFQFYYQNNGPPILFKNAGAFFTDVCFIYLELICLFVYFYIQSKSSKY